MAFKEYMLKWHIRCLDNDITKKDITQLKLMKMIGEGIQIVHHAGSQGQWPIDPFSV